MPTYVARVELLGNPTADTYVKLHAAMKKADFLQTIVGVKATYDLPHAEYAKQNMPDESAESVRDKLMPIIAAIYTDYLLVVSKAAAFTDVAWYLKQASNN